MKINSIPYNAVANNKCLGQNSQKNKVNIKEEKILSVKKTDALHKDVLLSVSHNKQEPLPFINRRIKSKESEDAVIPKPVLRRQLSQPILRKEAAMSPLSPAKALFQDEAVKEHSPKLWDHMDSLPDPYSNGRIHRFSMKRKFDTVSPTLVSTFPLKMDTNFVRSRRLDKKMDEIFPAHEKSARELLWLDPTMNEEFLLEIESRSEGRSLQNVLELKNQVVKFYNQLGYRTTYTKDPVSGAISSVVYLPDREALLSRWERLRQKNPALQLPPLRVVSGEGIANDEDFLDISFISHALLSNGPEFFHDHTSHLIPTIYFMLFSEVSRHAPDLHLIKTIFPDYAKILKVKHLLANGTIKSTEIDRKILMATLSIFADRYKADPVLTDIPQNYMEQILGDDPRGKINNWNLWEKYLIKRFVNEGLLDPRIKTLDVSGARNLWEDINRHYEELLKRPSDLREKVV